MVTYVTTKLLASLQACDTVRYRESDEVRHCFGKPPALRLEDSVFGLQGSLPPEGLQSI